MATDHNWWNAGPDELAVDASAWWRDLPHADGCEVCCASCGKGFLHYHENQQWIRNKMYLICDRCLKAGWPWGGG